MCHSWDKFILFLVRAQVRALTFISTADPDCTIKLPDYQKHIRMVAPWAKYHDNVFIVVDDKEAAWRCCPGADKEVCAC